MCKNVPPPHTHTSGRSQYFVMLAIYRDLVLGLPQSPHQTSSAPNKIRKPVHMRSGNTQSGTMTGFFRAMTDVKPHFLSHAEAQEADKSVQSCRNHRIHNPGDERWSLKQKVLLKHYKVCKKKIFKASRGCLRDPWRTKTHSSASDTPSLFVPCVQEQCTSLLGS